MSRRFRRCGWSLLEVVAIVSVTSLLMGIVAATLVAMLRLGHETSERIAWQATWHRLALAFHDDAHAARSAALADGAEGVLTLTISDDEQVEYCRRNDGIDRLRLIDEKTAATESYLLSEGYAVQLSLADGPQGELAVVALTRAADVNGLPLPIAVQPLRIEALVARDHRLSTLVVPQEGP